MIDKGQMLSRHNFSKVNWGILAVATLLLCIGTALLLLPLLSDNQDESNILALLQAGAAIILLGCILLALRQYLRPNLTYRLYEHGVRVFNHHNQKERFVPFEKIGDIYRCRGGRLLGSVCDVMAFRTSADQPWYSISSNVANSWRLVDAIVNQQLQQRGPQELNALYQGKTLSFGYLKCRACWLGHLLPASMQGRQVQTLQLSATALVATQCTLPIEQIRALNYEPQRGTLRLFDNQGNELLTLCYFSLYSADLFIALLEHMIHNRIPAFHNPAMTRQQF